MGFCHFPYKIHSNNSLRIWKNDPRKVLGVPLGLQWNKLNSELHLNLGSLVIPNGITGPQESVITWSYIPYFQSLSTSLSSMHKYPG